MVLIISNKKVAQRVSAAGLTTVFRCYDPAEDTQDRVYSTDVRLAALFF